MMAYNTPISYHKEGVVKTEVINTIPVLERRVDSEAEESILPASRSSLSSSLLVSEDSSSASTTASIMGGAWYGGSS